jgi:hypothetical protein
MPIADAVRRPAVLALLALHAVLVAQALPPG